jgi:hypothetical protein
VQLTCVKWSGLVGHGMERDLPDVEQVPVVAPTWAREMASVPPPSVVPDDGIE